MTAKEVAEWMLVKIQEESVIYQNDVVYGIENKFGKEFVYENDSGNYAIGKNVLKEFRKLTEDIVVWDRRERLWRMRDDNDTAGSRIAD